MTLADLIVAHRAAYADDVTIPRLVSRQPPTVLDPDGELHVEPGAAIGMTLAGPFLRKLGHPEGYGAMYPWSTAMWRMRSRCRRDHPYHRAADKPYWRGSLCHEAVRWVVMYDWSLPRTASLLRYDHLEPVLREALRLIEEERGHIAAKAAQVAKQDEGVFQVGESPMLAHHRVGGLHAEDCPNPECRRAA